MSGIQVLNNFSFESGAMRVWRAYNVGPGERFTSAQVQGFGTPQGPTDPLYRVYRESRLVPFQIHD